MSWSTYHGYAERRCHDCRDWFYPRYGFERYCFPCWQDRQDAPARRCSNCGELERQLRQARAEAQTLRAALTRAERGQQHSPDWPHMLPRLIQLVHPDKHGGSHAANEATRWLLAQREKTSR